MGLRLAPLYIASALQWMNFWVGTDKPFMHSIGFTATLIGLAAAGYAIVAPSLEVPFGLLADRWSRIGVLRVGAVALAVAVILQGLSTEPVLNIAGKVVLAVFFAATSGTYESLMYDTLAQAGDQASFAARLGWFRLIGMSAGALGALAGGVIVAYDLRLNYALSAGTAIVAIAVLSLAHEPHVNLAAPRSLAGGQLRETLRRSCGPGRCARSSGSPSARRCCKPFWSSGSSGCLLRTAGGSGSGSGSPVCWWRPEWVGSSRLDCRGTFPQPGWA